jgi:putative membrane protein
MMNGMGMMGMMTWGVLNFLLGLLLIFLFVLAVVAAVKWLWGQKFPLVMRRGGESALEVLKKRYAKGEISKDDYEKIRADIQ